MSPLFVIKEGEKEEKDKTNHGGGGKDVADNWTSKEKVKPYRKSQSRKPDNSKTPPVQGPRNQQGEGLKNPH